MPRVEEVEADVQKKVVKAAEQDRPDVAQRRAEWIVRQAGLDPEKLLFLDEFGAKTNFTRTHGRSLEGTRLVAKVPYGHWKSTTFVGALGLRGWVAPLVIDGALNGELFRAYVEQQLAPQLSKGDILILDNLACHKVAGVRAALQRVGADVLYLPPYSPDFNPIEQAFSKLKRLLSSAAARTVDALWHACGAELAKFHPGEFQNYLAHCGYKRYS